MKRSTLTEGLFTLLNGIFYGSLISFAALSTLITAFSLHLPPVGNSFFIPLELKTLLWYCILFSAVFSLCFSFKKLWILAPVLLLCYLSYGWYYGTLKNALFDFLYIISKRYDNAYGCGVVLLIEERPYYTDLTMVFRSFAAMGTAIITWSACKRQSSYWVLLFCLLCFAACCVITNTVPAPWALFILFLSLALFLMTGHVRKNSSQHATLLSLCFTIPVAVAAILLFTLISPETYNGKDRADALLDYFQNGLDFSGNGSGSSTHSADSVDLSTLGKRRERNVPVMYITAPESRTYYLRGEVYGTYTGTSWKAERSVSELPWSDGALTDQVISIDTRFSHEMLYVPYCADPDLLITAGNMLPNPDGLKEYQFNCYKTANNVPYDPSDEELAYWTALPQHTYSWAKPFTDSLITDYYNRLYEALGFTISATAPSESKAPNENNPLHYSSLTDLIDMRNHAAIKAISEYVRSTARYSLHPSEMDSTYKDFAQWFVEEGEEGYCVHFAATAAVLLRAAGIPARYVSGYMVAATAGKEATVYQKNAHAWVEYWDHNKGWQVLEATPARQEEEPTDPSETESTTQAEETTEPTQSTTLPTETEDSTMPIPTGSSGESSSDSNNSASGSRSPLWSILKWSMVALCMFLFVVAQRILRLRLWQNSYNHASEQVRVLKSWNRAVTYAKLLKEPPDPKLRSIAEKAKFSQHRISAEELEQFETFFRASQEKLNSHPFYLRLYARWILTLY